MSPHTAAETTLGVRGSDVAISDTIAMNRPRRVSIREFISAYSF